MFSRRRFLQGAGGVVVALPLLEGLAPKNAYAAGTPPFALFYRKPNGVAQFGHGQLLRGCAEHFWPDMPSGTELTAANCPDENLRGTGALTAKYWKRATVLKGLAHPFTDWGHECGVYQMFTGAKLDWLPQKPKDPTRGWYDYKLNGESLDNRIARELTGKEESLALLLHQWGGQQIPSFLRTKNERGSQTERQFSADYRSIFDRLFAGLGADDANVQRVRARRQSVNDSVREQISRLRKDTRLSKSDQDRLDLHFSSIRDLERLVGCDPSKEGNLRNDASGFEDRNRKTNYNETYRLRRDGAEIASRLAALAFACGVTRSIVVSPVGGHTDDMHYDDEFSAEWSGFGDMHESISHGKLNEDRTWRAHQLVDIAHFRMFRKFLDRLDAYDFGGTTLLDAGVSLFASDIGHGCHTISDVPYIYVGGAGGKLKTGLFLDLFKGGNATPPGQTSDATQRMQMFEPPVKLLNTIGAAVGCKNAAGGPLDDFNADNNGGIRGRFNQLVL